MPEGNANGAGDITPPPRESASTRRSWRQRNIYPLARILIIFLVPLLYILVALPTGFLLESPGPSFDLQSGLTVRGAETYPSDGQFLLTAVGLQESRLIYHLLTPFGVGYELIKIRDYLGEDMDVEEEEVVNKAMTLLSQGTANVVALQETAKPVEIDDLGALVLAVHEDYPAHGKLEAGEVIVSVNGEPAENSQQIREAISSKPPGEEIRLGVRELDTEALEKMDEDDAGLYLSTSEVLEEEVREVELSTAWDPDLGRAVVGVAFMDYFDYSSQVKVQWDLEGVEGPSAGLMMTLSLINVLTPGDLTGGRKVAGTGMISLDGQVGAIGGLPMKIRAAEEEGAEVFIYPRDNQEDLDGVSTSLELYPAGNLQEALDVLANLH